MSTMVYSLVYEILLLLRFSILQDLGRAQRNGESHGPFFH